MVPHYEVRPEGLGYRQRQGADIWHFCSNCSRWPGSNYIELWIEPTTGEICSECEEKRAQGDCCTDIIPTVYKPI
jgi:hypothetical protein